MNFRQPWAGGGSQVNALRSAWFRGWFCLWRTWLHRSVGLAMYSLHFCWPRPGDVRGKQGEALRPTNSSNLEVNNGIGACPNVVTEGVDNPFALHIQGMQACGRATW